MKVNQNDYVILRVGTKTVLARCTHAEEKSYKAVLEKAKDGSETNKPDQIEFEFSDVVSNLGRSPKVGSVYGQKVEPLLKQFTAGNLWENVKLYQRMTEAEETALKHELVVASKHLRKMKLGGLKHIIEVRQPSGKYAGYHKYRPKEEVDILCIKPEVNLEGLQYLIYHEYAHGIWSRWMTLKSRFQWVKLYHHYVTLKDLEEQELKQLLEYVESAGSIRDFLKDADEDSLVSIKDVIKHIKNVHNLTQRHLEMALQSGEPISGYWPVTLETSQKELCLTDYARKSPEELFAETFAMFACGRKLPKAIQSLLDLTLTRLSKGSTGKDVATPRADPESRKPKSKRRSTLK